MIPRSSLLVVATTLTAACGDSSAGPKPAAIVEVTAVSPVTYADGFPAFTFTVANRGSATADNVQLDVQALRGTTVVDQGVALVQDVRPGQSVISDPAVLAKLSSHADYACYQYRVRVFETADGQFVSDTESEKVCK